MSTLYGSTKLALSKDRPQGCLLLSTSETTVSSPAPVQMEDETVSVHNNAIWPEYCSFNIYSDNETPDEDAENPGGIRDNNI